MCRNLLELKSCWVGWFGGSEIGKMFHGLVVVKQEEWQSDGGKIFNGLVMVKVEWCPMGW